MVQLKPGGFGTNFCKKVIEFEQIFQAKIVINSYEVVTLLFYELKQYTHVLCNILCHFVVLLDARSFTRDPKWNSVGKKSKKMVN